MLDDLRARSSGMSRGRKSSVTMATSKSFMLEQKFVDVDHCQENLDNLILDQEEWIFMLKNGDLNRIEVFSRTSSLEAKLIDILWTTFPENLSINGDSPLHLASRMGHLDVVRFLLKYSCCHFSRKSSDLMGSVSSSPDISSLMHQENSDGDLASQIAYNASIAFLIDEFRERYELICKTDLSLLLLLWKRDTVSFLHGFSTLSDEQSLKVLYNWKDPQGMNVLHSASILELPFILEELISKFFGIVVSKLPTAASHSKSFITTHLSSLQGNTPFHEAVRFQSWNCVRIWVHISIRTSLLKDLLQFQNKRGETATDIASKKMKRFLRQLLDECSGKKATLFSLLHSSSKSVNRFRPGRSSRNVALSLSKSRGNVTSTKSKTLYPRMKRKLLSLSVGRPAGVVENHNKHPSGSNLSSYDPKQRDRVTGRYQLHKYSYRGDTEAVKELLLLKADVDAVDNAGYTALHSAALQGHAGVVQLLLASRANPNQTALDGDTPLHDAAENNHFLCVKLLLQFGASPAIKNCQGKTPIDISTSDEICNVIQSFLPASSSTPHGHVHSLEFTDIPFSANALDSDVSCKAPRPRPLRDSFPSTQLQPFSETLEVAYLFDRDWSGRNCLMRAACQENVPLLSSLLDLVVHLDTSRSGECILSSEKRSLLYYVVNQRNIFGWTALHEAAVRNNITVARLLIDTGKIEINLKAFNGNTCLHEAVSALHLDMVFFLLDKGADPLIVNNDNLRPSQLLDRLPLALNRRYNRDKEALHKLLRAKENILLPLDASSLDNGLSGEGRNYSDDTNDNLNGKIIYPCISGFSNCAVPNIVACLHTSLSTKPSVVSSINELSANVKIVHSFPPKIALKYKASPYFLSMESEMNLGGLAALECPRPISLISMNCHYS